MTLLDLPPQTSGAHDYSEHPSLGGEAIAGFELAALLSSSVYLGIGVPRGNGRTVLVIPGFLGSDEYLRLLRGWLQRIGYTSRASGIALNFGTPSSLIANLQRRIEYISQQSPGRMIVIGHSLGGVFARALAVLRPDLIAHAICMGSPLGPNPRGSSHPLVAELGNLLLSERGGDAANRVFEQALLDTPLPATVELTSIYTKSDAVVSWRSCIDPDPRARAIEVRGTHTGLAWNAQVYRILGPLLASSPL
jgi:triacylglycerol lipase